MKVLLTGAFGTVGSSTMKALLAEGHEVVAFDLATPRARKLAASLDGRVRVVFGDITKPESLRAGLEGVDAVIHLAAIVLPEDVERAPEFSRRINVDATIELIAQMEASSTAKRLVFASSQGVHGDIQDREPPLRADMPVSPTNEYGRQKVACEQAIRGSRLDWTVLRLAAVAPIEMQTKSPEVMFDYSAEARFEFVHPYDAGTAFARAVSCKDAIRKIMFVGGGERCQTTFYEFCTKLMAGIGMGHIPREAFIKTEVPTFLGDWVDTDDSQRLLRYQTRDMSDLIGDMKKEFGIIVPLIRTLSPLATWFFISKSGYLKENRRRARLGLGAEHR